MTGEFMEKKKYYLFDFDGTLVDSMPTYGNLMLRILDEYKAKYDDGIIKIITPLGFIGTTRYFIDELGINESEETLTSLMLKYAIDAYTNDVPAKEHVIEALKLLKEKGASLNVLTASPHETLDPCLKRLGIYDMFDNVWSCNDFATTKADPDIYRRAAKLMGVAPNDVIFLDDNFNADMTAKSAGMTVFGVYDDSSDEYVEEIKAITDKYIYDFRELI